MTGFGTAGWNWRQLLILPEESSGLFCHTPCTSSRRAAFGKPRTTLLSACGNMLPTGEERFCVGLLALSQPSLGRESALVNLTFALGIQQTNEKAAVEDRGRSRMIIPFTPECVKMRLTELLLRFRLLSCPAPALRIGDCFASLGTKYTLNLLGSRGLAFRPLGGLYFNG